MISDSRTYWDDLFGRSEYVYGTAPSLFLQQNLHRFSGMSHALDVAAGEGRNAVWLARQGIDVIALDFSQIALHKTKQLADQTCVTLETLCVDVSTWCWPLERFDLVLASYLHLAPSYRGLIHKRMAESLKPGGILILEGFLKAQAAAAGSGAAMLSSRFYSRRELTEDFYKLQVLECLEGLIQLQGGPMHRGQAEIVRFLAQRSCS